MTISAAIISTITIRLTVYTETKADTAESREAALKATRADFVENIRENTKIY
jgi:hypothetical protein